MSHVDIFMYTFKKLATCSWFSGYAATYTGICIVSTKMHVKLFNGQVLKQ